MINRVLIRIRVVQVLYSYYQDQSGNVTKAESELQHSFQKSYDLYMYFLLLMIELTKAYALRTEAAKSKLLPTEADLNPNVKLLQNRFIKQLENNEQLLSYIKDRPLSWEDQESFVKSVLTEILESETYRSYIKNEQSDYNSDRDFWKKVFRKIIIAREDLVTLLENESIFWNDDVDIIQSFIIKTIKEFKEENGSQQELLPMFKDDEDRLFAFKLLRESLFNGKEYREMAAGYAQNWESERIAMMDSLIMQIAVAELINFPSIPVNVTLNEYIDMAKFYSTEKSASFINGILDAIVSKLRSEKKIIK